jgi:hypothetical protein
MLTSLGGIGAIEADVFGLGAPAFEAAPPDFRVRRPSAMARFRRACKESAFCSGDVADVVDLMGTSSLFVAVIL